MVILESTAYAKQNRNRMETTAALVRDILYSDAPEDEVLSNVQRKVGSIRSSRRNHDGDKYWQTGKIIIYTSQPQYQLMY